MSTGIEFTVHIVVEPDGEQFHAFCPALKGLHVSGQTEEDALRNAVDAAVAYLESLIKHHEPIPLTVEVETPVRRRQRGGGHVSVHTETLEVSVA